MSTFQRLKEEFFKAIQQAAKSKSSAYDTQAEVLRIDEEGTAWVHIPGGAEETPVEMSIDAKEGDIVQVRVADGRAWMNGNNTAPPTDNTVANEAHAVATEMRQEVEDLEERFWHDSSGAHVEGEAYRNDMRSDGMYIVEKRTGETVAKFGASGSQVGTGSGVHSNVSADGFTVKKGDTTFFDLDAIFESSGSETIAAYDAIEDYEDSTITLTCTEDISLYDLEMQSSLTPIWLNGVQLRAQTPLYYWWNKKDNNVTLDLSLLIPYNTGWTSGEPYLAEGDHIDIIVDAKLQTIKGLAFGLEHDARALATFLFGLGLISNRTYQMAIGQYNAAHLNAALIVGNGSDAARRSNAAAITWDGDYEFGLDRTAASGTVDGDLYAAINAKGWLNSISGTGDLISLKKLLAEIIKAI